MLKEMNKAYLGSQSHTSTRQQILMCRMRRHHAEFAFVDEGEEVLDFFFQRWVFGVVFGVGVCGLVAGVCVAVGHGCWCCVGRG